MRRLSCVTALLVSLLFVFNPSLEANSSKPVSGTVLALNAGAWSTILIGGFASCGFEVQAMSSNEKVATVAFKAGKKSKSHKVMVRGESAGTAMVTVMTANSSNPGCQGFVFTFPVEISPDKKAFLKQGKQKLKQTTKQIGADLNVLIKELCDGIKDGEGLLKSGALSVGEALAATELGGAIFAGLIQTLVDGGINFAYTELWNRPEATGFTSLDSDLIGLTPGGCGDWDNFVAAAKKLEAKAVAKAEKKFKKFQKAVDKEAKKQQIELINAFLILTGQHPLLFSAPLPTPTPGTPPAAAPKPLTHNWTSSARESTDVMTRLRLAGTGDPGLGQVKVKIEGADGFEMELDLDLDADCNFVADFMNIPQGEYTVTMTQGTRSTSFKANGA